MSEQSNDNPKPVAPTIPSELLANRDFAGVDSAGLTRAIDLLASGHLDGESAAALLRHELATVQRQSEATCDLLQKSSIELRQLRESAQREQVQMQDEQRQLQDQNDRFVANLIHEHDVEKATLRRERDAAIDRVRELSRGLTRSGSSSTASMPGVSINTAIRSAPPAQDVIELKARIDELLHERDRSLRLLRQLAEQRDLAENRLQAALASTSSAIPKPRESSNATSPSRPQSNTLALATLEDPDNWEVGPPALAGNSTPGAYSLVAGELSNDEVHVSRTPRNVPKST
jgi:hypothetical protein